MSDCIGLNNTPCLKKPDPVTFSNNSNPLSIVFGTKNDQFNLHLIPNISAQRDKNRKLVRIIRKAVTAFIH